MLRACFMIFVFGAAAANRQVAGQTDPSASGATIRADTKLVAVDVAVFDRDHRPVTRLTAGDFAVFEDGAIQKLKSFEFHGARRGLDDATNAKEETARQAYATPGVFSNGVAPDGADSMDVILLDNLNTQMADQSFVRSQLRSFLKTNGAGGRLAVFALRNSSLIMVQGFTGDTRLLEAAVDRPDAVSASALLSDASGMGGDGPLIEQTWQGRALQLQLRERYTLEAIDELARYLGQLPGRKNLIWFAGSFPFSIVPDVSLRGAKRMNLEAEEQLRATSRLLTEGRIAVYPVDSHGGGAAGGNDALNSNAEYISRPDLLAKDVSDATRNENADHATMGRIALETGGRAFYSTNGLDRALSDAIQDGSSFYTLAYAPPESGGRSEEAFHAIEVQVRGQGYELAYRRGYFSDRAAGRALTADETVRGEAGFAAAMRRGAPDAMQIIFKARVLPLAGGTEANSLQNGLGNRKAKGPWKRYQIDLAADPRPLQWAREKDGSFLGKIEFVAVVYDEQGRAVNSLSETMQPTLSPAGMAEAGRSGVAVGGQISVPTRATCWLRIGIRDVATNRVGTVELPVSLVKDLPAADGPSR